MKNIKQELEIARQWYKKQGYTDDGVDHIFMKWKAENLVEDSLKGLWQHYYTDEFIERVA